MSLKRNVTCLTIEKAVHTLGGMACMVLVAQYLGIDALADYGFAISLTAFFIPILDFGMNNRIIKAVAGGEGVSKAVEDVVAYKLTVAPLSLVLMVAVALGWGRGGQLAFLVLLVGVSTVSMSLGDGASSVFKGLQKSHISCWMIVVLNLVLVLGVAVSVVLGWGLAGVGWFYAISRLVYAGGAFYLLKRKVHGSRFRVRLGLNRATMVEGLFHLPGIYYIGNLLSLTYLVTYALSPAEAGLYYVGYRATAAAYVMVSAAFEAVLASAVSDGQRPSGLAIWFVIYSLAAMLLLFVTAPLTPIIFGESFGGSIRPIRLLVSAVPPFALCGLAHTLLMAARRERLGTWVMLAFVVGGLGLALIGQVTYGTHVTALTPAFSALVAMVVLWGCLSRQGNG
jgi:O-antigen/teichoic acid export membrane protein